MKKLFNKVWESFVVSPIGCLLMLPMMYDAPSKEELDKLVAEQGVKRQPATEPEVVLDNDTEIEVIEFKKDV